MDFLTICIYDFKLLNFIFYYNSCFLGCYVKYKIYCSYAASAYLIIYHCKLVLFDKYTIGIYTLMLTIFNLIYFSIFIPTTYDPAYCLGCRQ